MFGGVIYTPLPEVQLEASQTLFHESREFTICLSLQFDEQYAYSFFVYIVDFMHLYT